MKNIFYSFKGLLIKQITQIFFEGESPTLIFTLFWHTLNQIFSCHVRGFEKLQHHLKIASS